MLVEFSDDVNLVNSPIHLFDVIGERAMSGLKHDPSLDEQVTGIFGGGGQSRADAVWNGVKIVSKLRHKKQNITTV